MNGVFEEFLIKFTTSLWQNQIFKLCVLCVVADTIFGCMRAVKQREFNSCFGIDGALRKGGMLVSLVFFKLFDELVHINLISFMPEEVGTVIGISRIGTAEFFGLLYVAYEVVSILKNLALCGLPLKAVCEKVREFLSKWTTELPDEN